MLLLLAAIGSFLPVSGREQVAIAQPMLVAQSVLNTASSLPLARMSECREGTVYVGWSAGVTAGAITIESAVDDTYGGTWAPITTITYASGAPKQELVQLTGVYWGFRTRISTVLAGGTVNTWLVCN